MGARNIAIIKLWSSEGTTTGLGARSTRVIPTGKFPATISAKSRHVLHALLAKPPFTRLFAVFCNPSGLGVPAIDHPPRLIPVVPRARHAKTSLSVLVLSMLD